MSGPNPAHKPSPWRKRLMRLCAMLWIIVGIVALWGLWKEWSKLSVEELRHAFSHVGVQHVLLAVLFTAAGYLCNTGIGILAQHLSNHPRITFSQEVAENFIVSAFTMNAGGSVLGGGSMRLRFSTMRGVSPVDTGRAMLYSGFGGWSGHILVCGILLTLVPPPLVWLEDHHARWVGLSLLVFSLLLPWGSRVWPRKWPSPRLVLAIMALSLADWLCAGFAMWALFPGSLPMDAGSFVAVVVVAQAVATLSHVPGGVGVLELAMTKALAGAVAAPVMAGALIIYRLVFYLLPFIVSLFMLGIHVVSARPAEGTTLSES